ncbi:hypothetical protein ACFLS1_03130 [Verrucomicrobiota bacterium]
MRYSFKKNPAISKRLKKIRKELSSVSTDIRSLAKSVDKTIIVTGVSEEAGKKRIKDKQIITAERNSTHEQLDRAMEKNVSEQKTAREKSVMHDQRFVSYLETKGFRTAGVLRHEKRIQRNKAIIICIVVVLVLWWLLDRFFL